MLSRASLDSLRASGDSATGGRESESRSSYLRELALSLARADEGGCKLLPVLLAEGGGAKAPVPFTVRARAEYEEGIM